ncbi:hypothetical protein POL68_42115 [Stigmatella sp. ncwal1]|uniref:Peptidase MA-like domain-containing protein n=1 Tax=Stigmatella ashevillensis TaxID=2995309 RepID=A0ABT5DQ10_9BACT|nr:hypothetical protein [Stigmatella ashevillena]MDC0715119.1 hypothetical protein [Stigmatella ashevillena]
MTGARSHIRAGLVAALCLLLGTGCLGPRSALAAQAAPLETGLGVFILESPSRKEGEAAMLQVAIENATPRLTQWGRLTQPVTVRLQPDHGALERATGRSGYEWLRAWARYDLLDVQAPDTWHPLKASQRDLDELLLHELTHTVMFQLAASSSDWTQKKIPAWFREGMASYTAEQAYRWPTLEQLARTLEDNPDWEPLLQPEELFEQQMQVAYGAAHHAFVFLMNRYGQDTVKRLIHAMRQGPDFQTAFASTVGLPSEAFLRDFTRYVRLRGFKGGRLLQSPAAL